MSTIRKVNGKVYIEGVRRISWDTGEMCEFASAFISAVNSLGEDIPYHYVMGTSGVAFRFTLNPGGWDYGNYSIRNISHDPYEPIRRAFNAVGYEYIICEKGPGPADTARIMSSIDKGVPVLAFHVVGPSDCCIITGYDEGGKVLLGWSTFQDIPDDHNIPPDVTGYFRKPGWHDNLPGYVLVGAKVERPPLRDIYIDALGWAVYLMRSTAMENKVMPRKAMGLEALRVWADEMTQEKYFPPQDDQNINQRYLSTAINMTMLRDHCSAEPFLRQVAEDVPDFEPELSQAAGCYTEMKRIRGEMDGLIGDNFTEKAIKAIVDPDIRRSYASAIMRIHDAESEAVTHIEHLLERCGK